jgi:hypothetical protein
MIREILARFALSASRGGCLLAVSMLVVFSAPTPASAGLFDFLFDPKAPIWNPFAPEPQQARPIQRAAPVRKKKPLRPVAHAPRLEKAHPSGAPLASRDFLDDSSLRGGDAVMTANGIRIFTGPPGDRHRPEQFATLDKVKGIGKRERSELSALDARANGAKRTQAKPILATGRSAAENITAGALVTDPKGRSIRYVGP